MENKKSLSFSFTLNSLPTILPLCWKHMEPFGMIVFSGDMGAGKTTFIHHLCRFLGVTDSISSPTFALVNEYHFTVNEQDRTIFHMDWYRLKSDAEALEAGVGDLLSQATSGSGVYCFVEWPEKVAELLWPPYLYCHLTVEDENTRMLSISMISDERDGFLTKHLF